MNPNFARSLCGHSRGVLQERVTLSNEKLSWSLDYVYTDILQGSRALPRVCRAWGSAQQSSDWVRLAILDAWCLSSQLSLTPPLTRIQTLRLFVYQHVNTRFTPSASLSLSPPVCLPSSYTFALAWVRPALIWPFQRRVSVNTTSPRVWDLTKSFTLSVCTCRWQVSDLSQFIIVSGGAQTNKTKHLKTNQMQ